MRRVAWMIGPSLVCWLAATAVFGRRAGLEMLLGMLAPLVATAASWISIARAHRRNPQSVTGVLMAGFAAKMVFFGGYVLVVLRVFGVRAVPFFIASFTAYFIGLYLVEALYLKGLSSR